MKPTRILLVDDHQLFCEGMRALIERQQDMKVVGVATDGRQGVRLAKELAPDIVVMDVAMSELNGAEATRQILEELPRIRVIALSMHGDRRYVLRMLEAGASGYLLKDCAVDELARAIRSVVANQVYLSPAVAGVVVERLVRRGAREPGGPSATEVLSTREIEVLQLLAEGHTARQIGQALHVSVKTVETHRRNIMDKLDLHSIAGLTKYAVREGITSLER